jgi:hypothetical protein
MPTEQVDAPVDEIQDPAAVQKHIDAMTSKADQGLDVNGSSDEPEKLLAGKYKSEEDLHKGIIEVLKKTKGEDLESVYADLAKGLGSPDQPGESGVGDDAPGEGEGDADPESGEGDPADDSGDADKADPDQEGPTDQEVTLYQKAVQEFAKDGTPSDETLAEFEKLGYPKDMVVKSLAADKTEGEAFVKEVHDSVGGKDLYDRMVSWAKKGGFTESEVALYDQTLQSGNKEAFRLLTDGLKQRYIQANGSPTRKRVEPGSADGGGAQASAQGYQSRAQMVADMNDPRYAKDPAYRARVMEKVKYSSIF